MKKEISTFQYTVKKIILNYFKALGKNVHWQKICTQMINVNNIEYLKSPIKLYLSVTDKRIKDIWKLTLSF